MNSRKAYVIDPALCHRLGFSFSENTGRILENIVLIQLLRKGAEVYYHKENKECDQFFQGQSLVALFEYFPLGHQLSRTQLLRPRW